MSELTIDDVPLNPLSAYRMGLAQGRGAMRSMLDRLGERSICRLGHPIWVHRFWNGEAWDQQGILENGMVDHCGD